MWSGNRPSVEVLSKQMDLTAIKEGYTNASIFPKSTKLKTFVHTLPHVPFVEAAVATINLDISHSTDYLLKALHAARRTKSPGEIVLMRKAAEITREAHLALMRGVGRGVVKDENEAEAIFVATCRKLGAKEQAYTPIVANGVSAGTLHYISNDAEFIEPSLLLVDVRDSFPLFSHLADSSSRRRERSTRITQLISRAALRSGTVEDSRKNAGRFTRSFSRCKTFVLILQF